MAARLGAQPVHDPPPGWVDDGRPRPSERWGVLATRPDLLAAVETYGAALEHDTRLSPRHRAIARLVVSRRSDYEHALQRASARAQADLGDAEFEAIRDENWADECFDDVERTVFRVAATFDAGHGVPAALLEELRAHLSDAQVVELFLVCGHTGVLSRIAIAADLRHDVDGLS
jgi:alkylhydroperoxidase family enzyme